MLLPDQSQILTADFAKALVISAASSLILLTLVVASLNARRRP